MIILLVGAGCAEPTLPPTEWIEGEAGRSRALRVQRGSAGFEPVTGTGIDLVGTLTDTAFVANRHRVNGAGVAIGDVDGDGWPDVFLAGLEAPSRLCRNLGRWQFEDITAASGLELSAYYNTGAALLDADGDADLDLVLTTLDGPSMLWLNDGSGVFAEASQWPGRLAGPRGGTTIAAADIEGDGDLDVYVTNYKRQTVKDLYHPSLITFEATVDRQGDRFVVKPPFDAHYRVQRQENRVMRYEYGEQDLLLRNEGGGRFEDATSQAFGAGGAVATDWGLAAQFRDLDGDLDPDLYVANDFESPDHVWFNLGDGTFRPAPTLTFRHTPQSSMAVDGSDVDRDGDVDLFVTEMLSRTHERRLRQVGNPPPIIASPGQIHVRPQVMHNGLFMSRPAVRSAGRSDVSQMAVPEFAETAFAFDVAASEWSWTALFMDVDLDGWEDLLISTGHRYDAMDLDAQTSRSGMASGQNWTGELLEFPSLDLKNVAFRNEHGTRFADMPDGWGIGLEPDVTHGMAFGDLDGDGDLDVVTNRLNRPAGVFRNTASSPRITVRLRGADGNTHGVGAQLALEGGGLIQTKEITAGGYYLSGSEAVAVFAALDPSLRLSVTFRSGSVVSLVVHPNNEYEVHEPPPGQMSQVTPPVAPPGAMQSSGATERVATQSVALPSLLEAQELARHVEAPFEDRARQPLLLRRLSHEGPYLARGDLDGDGLPDVAVSAGAGGIPILLHNQEGRINERPVTAFPPGGMDATGVAIAGGRLLVAVSGYEADRASRVDQFAFDGRDFVDRGELDLGRGSPGPMAVADVDGDGDEDVFVGTRFLPGRYPESAPSVFLLRDGDGWTKGPQLDAGMVTGADFADVDGDGDQDLALSTEWGAVRLFENDGHGQFEDATGKWGLAGAVGLWRSARWADVTGDGLPDLITTNWGWNSPSGRIGAPDYEGRGRRLYWGDFDRNGSVDPVEAEFAPGIGDWAPAVKLMDLVRGLRYVARRVSSAMEYANADIGTVLGPAADQAAHVTANQLGHMAWINTGSRLEPRLLPEAAQWTTASGVAALDLNDDGYLDLVLSQNFFPVLPEDATRQDGGNGMILLGNGTGEFSVWRDALGVFGDGRGILAVDLDQDGLQEIVIGQNAAPAWLFRRVR